MFRAAAPPTVAPTFAAQLAGEERPGKPRDVMLESDGGSLVRAQLSIGRGRLTLHLSERSPFNGNLREEHRVYLLVPTMSLQSLAEPKHGLRVAHCEPDEAPLFLRFATQAEAAAVQKQLRDAVLLLIQSLHIRAPPAAPLLALKPSSETRAQADPARGPFLLGGHVLLVEPTTPTYSLCWTELCGPDDLGQVSFYHYSSHRGGAWLDATLLEEGAFLSSHVLRVPMPGPKDSGHGPIARDAALAFRCSDEAKLWLETAQAARDGAKDRLSELPLRVDEVCELLRRMSMCAGAPQEPLLQEFTWVPRPAQPAPHDDVAQFWRRRRQDRDADRLSVMEAVRGVPS